MPKKAAGLTALGVKQKKKRGTFADGGGLYLQVGASGAKSWIYRFQINGRRRDMGLGSAVGIGLTTARQKAADARRLVAAGVDPIEHMAAQKAAAALARAKSRTFRDCAESYIESMRLGWRNPKHAAQWPSTLGTYAYPLIGSLLVSDIDTGQVVRVLEPIWRTKTETASRLRGRIEAILDHAKVLGYREGDNPARWKGHLSHILPAKGAIAQVTHHRAMPYTDVPAFWPLLRGQPGMGARALEFAILTATRTNEVLGARWSEISLSARLWTIPAERMKAGEELRVPLSDGVVSLLEGCPHGRHVDFVFPGRSTGTPLSTMTMLETLRRMTVPFTPHGFRASFRTWVSERTGFPGEVAEAALGHVQGDRIIAAYQRGDLLDRRRNLMTAWALFVEGEQEV